MFCLHGSKFVIKLTTKCPELCVGIWNNLYTDQLFPSLENLKQQQQQQQLLPSQPPLSPHNPLLGLLAALLYEGGNPLSGALADVCHGGHKGSHLAGGVVCLALLHPGLQCPLW